MRYYPCVYTHFSSVFIQQFIPFHILKPFTQNYCCCLFSVSQSFFSPLLCVCMFHIFDEICELMKGRKKNRVDNVLKVFFLYSEQNNLCKVLHSSYNQLLKSSPFIAFLRVLSFYGDFLCETEFMCLGGRNCCGSSVRS